MNDLHRTDMTNCTICPRRCGVNRESGEAGFCRSGALPVVSRCAPHLWEEPPVSGTRGSGALFLAGCNLRCVFCQNQCISHEPVGRAVTEEELADMLLRLADTGVHNLNLVTPTHHTPTLTRVLEKVKPLIDIPVIWNSSAYELPETLAMLDGLVDVFLPDFKYASPEIAAAYSKAPDYPARAASALASMYRLAGPIRFDAEGLVRQGVIIRHLVLPGCRRDSIEVLRQIAQMFDPPTVRVSVMRQYTPDFLDPSCPHKNLRRRVTEFEYASVLEEADRLGLIGYRQGKEAATAAYTPNFTDEPIEPYGW